MLSGFGRGDSVAPIHIQMGKSGHSFLGKYLGLGSNILLFGHIIYIDCKYEVRRSVGIKRWFEAWKGPILVL
jgi:hypothetical protein